MICVTTVKIVEMEVYGFLTITSIDSCKTRVCLHPWLMLALQTPEFEYGKRMVKFRVKDDISVPIALGAFRDKNSGSYFHVH